MLIIFVIARRRLNFEVINKEWLYCSLKSIIKDLWEIYKKSIGFMIPFKSTAYINVVYLPMIERLTLLFWINQSTSWPNGQRICDLSTAPLQSPRYLLESGWGRSFFSFRNLYKKCPTTVQPFFICNSMMLTLFFWLWQQTKRRRERHKEKCIIS